MLKFFKILFIFLAIVVILLVSLPFFIDVNDYKPEIKAAVFEQTGREINIENIKLSLFPWVGVTLSSIKLKNAKTFEAPSMIEIATVDVQVALAPLFDGQVKVKRFNLDKPVLWFTQNVDGTNNWSDLDNSSTSEPKPTTTSKPQQPKTSHKSKFSNLPIVFEAKLLNLSNGEIHWFDKSKGKISLKNIQLKVIDLQLKQPIKIDLSAQLGNNDLNINAEIGPVLSLQKLDWETMPALVKIKSNNFSLQPLAAWLPELTAEQEAMFGKMSNTNLSLELSLEQHADKLILSSGSLQVNAKNKFDAAWKLNIKAHQTLKLENFNLNIDNKDILVLSGNVRNLLDKPKFEAKLTTSKLQRIWLNNFIPTLETLYLHHSKPWQTVKAEAFLAGDDEILEIRNMQLALDNEPIQLSGDVVFSASPDIQLRVTASELNLDPWIPQSKQPSSQTSGGSSASNQMSSPASEEEPNLTFLKSWYLSVQLQAKTIHVKKLKLENLRMTFSCENGVARLNPLSFDINGGHVRENMTVFVSQYPVAWKESMQVKSVSIQPVLKSLVDFDKLSGLATLNTDLTGKGLLPSTIISSMNGRGNFLFEEGQFKGVDIAKEVRKLKKQPHESQQSDFAQMQGTFYIKKAVLTNSDLYMASPLFRLSGKGKIHLDPPSIDFQVRPRLIQSLQGQGGSSSDKGVVIPLHITGPFDNINVDVEVDKNSLLESAGALNSATGNTIGGVGGQILDQGFVETRDEQAEKATAAAKQKLAEEKANALQKAEDAAKEKLQNVLKGFKF